MTLKELPVSDTAYNVLTYIACSTDRSVLSEYILHKKSAVWRRGSFLNPAIFDYVDTLCIDKKYDRLMQNLHEIILLTYINADGSIFIKTDEQNERRFGCLGITKTTITLRDILNDMEAEPLIDDIEQAVRQAKQIFFSTGPFTMHFRTIEESSSKFHIDTPSDVYGLSYGPSCTEGGPLSSFEKLPSFFGEKQFTHIDGEPLFKLERGDASVLKIPHRAGTLKSFEEIEKYNERRMWVGIYIPVYGMRI